MRKIIRLLRRATRYLLIFLVEIYQHTFSPDHGLLKVFYPYGFCRHDPTCSENMKQQLHLKGLFFGLISGLKQLLTCHPWGKVDEERMRKVIREELWELNDKKTSDLVVRSRKGKTKPIPFDN